MSPGGGWAHEVGDVDTNETIGGIEEWQSPELAGSLGAMDLSGEQGPDGMSYADYLGDYVTDVEAAQAIWDSKERTNMIERDPADRRCE